MANSSIVDAMAQTDPQFRCDRNNNYRIASGQGVRYPGGYVTGEIGCGCNDYWTCERLQNFYTPPELSKRLVRGGHNMVVKFVVDLTNADIAAMIFTYIVAELPRLGMVTWDYQWWRIWAPYYTPSETRYDYHGIQGEWELLEPVDGCDAGTIYTLKYQYYNNRFSISTTQWKILEESPNHLLLMGDNENEHIYDPPHTYKPRHENTLSHLKITCTFTNPTNSTESQLLTIYRHYDNVTMKLKQIKKLAHFKLPGWNQPW